uniref:Uncharacterized protein n=1 Tax=Anguilla anguilla TaxID=7936 RepID=A0A0E9XB34_ANGAN
MFLTFFTVWMPVIFEITYADFSVIRFATQKRTGIGKKWESCFEYW